MKQLTYVNLDAYANLYKEGWKIRRSIPEAILHVAKDKLNTFKSEINNHFVSENVNANLFWSMLRAALRDGTLVSKMANYQPRYRADKGSDLFLKTLYASTEEVPVRYTSVAPNGEKVTLSGKIFLPPRKKIKNIIVANHYTICSNLETPSQAHSIEGIFATKDYIVIMPDYVGYGISSHLPHPYLQLESAVTSSIDLLKAAMPYIASRGFLFPKEVVLVGYSQGAAVTLAMQKKLEEEYADRFPLRRVFVGAGPYNLAKTYDYYVSQPKTNIPCSLPMLIIGMAYGENLPLKPEDYFQPELLEKYPNLIESKKWTMFEVNDRLDHRIDLLLTPLIFEKEKYPTSLLYEAMKKNSILGWTPKAPLYMFHSTEDDMVPFLNSAQVAYEFTQQLLTNVEYNFSPQGGHMNACATFFEKVYQSLY
ncbi:MAG: alpha/beta fold hydrolase [Paludibacteraceae bacterium]|nr:alpha/beta fold hydrolase [Paludibacteraceae bacterium]